ncbi:MAG: hypothetical protein GSR85_10135 [Desulfurococcales archaeon]|nr:hypothetical protein [Desulfurococcales archaeon]
MIVFYSISIITLGDVSVSRIQGFSLSSILLQPILLIAIMAVSLAILYYVTLLNRSILSSIAIPLILFQLSFIKPIPRILLLLVTIISYILIVIITARAISKGGGDALIDYKSLWNDERKRSIPYTLISSYLFMLYMYIYIIDYPYDTNGLLLHIVISMISLIISYYNYGSVLESHVSGILSALGPLGYAILTTWYSNKPIPLNLGCKGVIVGDLIAVEGRVATNRSIFRAHRSYWSTKTFFCVSKCRALMDINTGNGSSLLWIYGGYSNIIYNNIINKLNYPILIIDLDSRGIPLEELDDELSRITSILANRGKAILKLGSIEETQIKIATTATVINSLPDYDRLILIITTHTIEIRDVLAILKPAIEKASLIIIAVRNPPWINESLIPIDLGVKQGFIISGIRDPVVSSRLASTFLDSTAGAQEFKDLLQTRGIGIGYPLCYNKIFIFNYHS